jgi:ribosomal-protein-alanine N-acetyltransferase
LSGPEGDIAGAAGRVDFREIVPEDFEALRDFMEENNVPAVVRTFNPFPMTAETARRIACAPRLDRYYAALLGGRVVALSMLRGWDEGYSVPSFGIMVDHRLHGMGIGARVLDETVAEAARLGCRRVRLSVFAGNRRAVGLYLSRGFVEDSREPVTLPGGADERIIMYKELAP